MKHLLLIQTGQTQWQTARRLGGAGQAPLTDDGAARLADHLDQIGDIALDAILADGSEAAGQTADLVSRRLGGKVRRIEGLRDVHMGLWEGLTVEEVRRRYPRVYRQWQERPSAVRPPEGEEIGEAFGRIVEAVRAALSKRGANRVAVVVSPLAAGLLRCWLLDCGVDALWEQVRQAGPWSRHEVSGDRLSGNGAR